MHWRILQRFGVLSSTGGCFCTVLCFRWPEGIIAILHSGSSQKTLTVSVPEFRTGDHCPHSLVSNSNKNSGLEWATSTSSHMLCNPPSMNSK